jgi:hypothetical protein
MQGWRGGAQRQKVARPDARAGDMSPTLPITVRAQHAVDHWHMIGGATMLPGTNLAADRFDGASDSISEATPVHRPAHGHRRGLQRHAEREGAHRDLSPRPAQHRRHTLADGEQLDDQGPLLPGHQEHRHHLGETRRAGLQRLIRPAQAPPRLQPRHHLRPDQQLQARRAIQVHGAARLKQW